MFSALTVGIFGGGLLGLYLSIRVIQHISAIARSNLVYWTAAAGVLLIAFPAFFLAMVVGGSIGGGTGAELGNQFGAEGIGASIGVAIGLGLVLAAGLLFGAFIGAMAGRLIGAPRRGP
jgi:hypothetical protein